MEFNKSSCPLVSIITVNYNATSDTIEFLESCDSIDYLNIEIIVVDNGSQPPLIGLNHKNLKQIRSNSNLGFAGGNNLGVEASNGEYLFFLNNDTIVIPDFVSKIIEFFKRTSNVGAVSPKILYPDKKMIQYAGSEAISLITGRGKRIGRYEQDKGQYDEIKETDLCHGSALIVPRKVIDHVGKMPEIYFLYYEEHDWCEQIKRKGYKVYYMGNTSIIHKESVSTGKNSPLKTYYLSRNRLLFMRRNSNGLKFIVGLTFLIIISIPKNLLNYIIKGEMHLSKEYLRGLIWNLSH